MIVKDLKTLKELFKKIKTPIFGIGAYAFDRLGLENIISNYRIIVLRYSLDTKLIEKDIKVFSLEKRMGTKHIREPRNATTVLKLPQTKEYLDKFKNPAMLVLRASSKMERICKENNWQLLANPTFFGKKMFENKIKFRKVLQEIEVPIPPGKISLLDKLHYGHLINKYGLPFVIQHPTKGGGKGTFFIHNKEDFEKTIEKLEQKWDEEDEKKMIPPTEVIVAKFIQGPSPSIAGCVTQYGILSTSLQHQILDISQLYNPEKGSGLFCGHDWTSSNFDEEISKQAYNYVEKVGQHLKEHDYKGIFGLDFVLDEKTNQLYLVECNPRLLGTGPTINMAQLLNNEPPILAFHVLAFLDTDYQLDIDNINKLMRQKKIGAQMILHNLTGHWARNHQQLKAGIYKLNNKSSLKYLRPGYDLKHLENKEEFLLADGVSIKKSHFSPNRRLCRILTLNQVLDSSYKKLTPWANNVVEVVYKSFQIKQIHLIKFKKFFFPNFLAKG